MERTTFDDLGDQPLTLCEFVVAEALPLSEITRAVFEFLRANKKHAVLFGAHAVNLYADPPRMTYDVDVMTDLDAETMAESLRAHLAAKFHIAVRVRKAERGFRVYQVQKTGNRHLVDVRGITPRVNIRDFKGIHVIDPVDLVAMKVISLKARANRPKGLTDRVDLERLLVARPELREDPLLVVEALGRLGHEELVDAWYELASHPMEADEDD